MDEAELEALLQRFETEFRAKEYCARCGGVRFAASLTDVHKRPICRACALRPDVNYLKQMVEGYRREVDGYYALIATITLVHICVLLGIVVGLIWQVPMILKLAAPSQRVPLIGSTLLYLIPSILSGLHYNSKSITARLSIFILPISLATYGVLLALITNSKVPLLLLVPATILIAMLESARRCTVNKMFFGLAVSQDELLKLYQSRFDNQPARLGLSFGLLSILVPGIWILGLVLSGYGLAKVDPDGFPPVGGRTKAISGIVVGLIMAMKDAVVLIWLFA